MKQTPRIVKSTLSKPPKWFIVRRYSIREGVSVMGKDAGTKATYLVAHDKVDVTDQMEAILKADRRSRRKR